MLTICYMKWRLYLTETAGILTFGVDNLIHENFSRYLSDIYEIPSETIRGLNAINFCLKNCEIDEDGLDSVEGSLMSIIGQGEIAWELNEHLLPREGVLNLSGERHKHLVFDWMPILDEDGEVSKMMLSVRDITLQKQLEKEVAIQKQESDVLVTKVRELLSATREVVHSFFHESKERIAFISNQSSQTSVEVPTLFTELHTLKGGARTLGLVELKKLVHSAEDCLNIKSGSEPDIEMLELHLKSVVQSFEHYKKIYDDLFGASKKDHSSSINLSSLTALMIPTMKEKLDEVGIEIGKVEVADEIIFWNPDSFSVIKDSCILAVSNSIDHGFVRPSKKGKIQSPLEISLHAAKSNGNAVVTIADNGAGLDVEKLEEIAEHQNFDPGPEGSVCDVVFLDGASTADTVSDSSGRGVGMSAIKNMVHSLGGDVHIENKQHAKGCVLKMRIPIESVAQTFKKVS